MSQSVLLRQYVPTDIDAVWDAIRESRSEISRWMPWCHENYSRDDVIAWVEGRAAAWESDQEWNFAIVDANNDLLGGCGIHRIALMHGVAELGYWIRSSHTGRGLATAATKQLCTWAFNERSLRRIEILVALENLASQRVAAKVGAVSEGILRQRFVVQGKTQDCVAFAVLKDHFEF